MSGSSEFVILKTGVALPVEALQLAWELESRGLSLAVEGEALTVGPRDRLTDADRNAIRRWRIHLLCIAGQAEVTA